MTLKNSLIFFSILFSNILFNNVAFAQELIYENAKDDLKEFLAIQALLAENRFEELTSFLQENDYYSIPSNGSISYSKIVFDRKPYEVSPIIQIESGKFSSDYVDNSVSIFFTFNKNNGENSFTFSENEAFKIKQSIINQIEIGIPYKGIKELSDQYDSDSENNIEKIDRYTIKIVNNNDPNDFKIYKASNFMYFEQIKDRVFFMGPGKTMWTEIILEDPLPTKDPGRYMIRIITRSHKVENPQEINPFNLKFFMSLKNFNDRIWTDN